MSRDGKSPVQGFGRRGAIQIVDEESTIELTDVATKSVISVLATTFVTSIGITAAGLTATLTGVVLVFTAAVVGLAPLYRYLLRTRSPRRLTLSAVGPELSPVVVTAANAVDRIRTMADSAADGPVADHLAELATTAESYLISLHGAAVQLAKSDHPDPGVTGEISRISDRLSELAEAAERLARAQRRQLAEDSPLDDVIARTERLAEALEHETNHESPKAVDER